MSDNVVDTEAIVAEVSVYRLRVGQFSATLARTATGWDVRCSGHSGAFDDITEAVDAAAEALAQDIAATALEDEASSIRRSMLRRVPRGEDQ